MHNRTRTHYQLLAINCSNYYDLFVFLSSLHLLVLGVQHNWGFIYFSIYVLYVDFYSPSLYTFGCDLSVILFPRFLSQTDPRAFGRRPGTVYAMGAQQ